MPVFDAMTAGYLITTHIDVYVSIKNNQQYFEWPSLEPVGFHPIEQADKHPDHNEHSYFKWHNPWSIKTPKGYSTLFVQPMHRESLFTVLPGIVDTDTYTPPVNFSSVMKDPNFEGLIPKGTPIAQVIPFKREGWEMEIGHKKEFEEQRNITRQIFTEFFDRYKKMFWTPKEFK
jgi:hypothetical protein